MALPVLIMGQSGTGKSTSLRNFGQDEIALVNVSGKFLPFRGKFNNVLKSDDYVQIDNFIKNACKAGKKAIVIDAQYLMANEFMRRSLEKGYDKFTEMAKNFWLLVKLAEQLPEDVILYFLMHTEDADGRTKAKTIGKMIDEKITLEGMFTIVLKTCVVDGNYYFSTHNSGSDTVKSPMGLFQTDFIENNLKLVDEAIRSYYSFEPPLMCEECKQEILSDGKRTIKQIVAGTQQYYKQNLCMKCFAKLYTADQQKASEGNNGNP